MERRITDNVSFTSNMLRHRVLPLMPWRRGVKRTGRTGLAERERRCKTTQTVSKDWVVWPCVWSLEQSAANQLITTTHVILHIVAGAIVTMAGLQSGVHVRGLIIIGLRFANSNFTHVSRPPDHFSLSSEIRFLLLYGFDVRDSGYAALK